MTRHKYKPSLALTAVPITTFGIVFFYSSSSLIHNSPAPTQQRLKDAVLHVGEHGERVGARQHVGGLAECHLGGS